MNRLSFWVCILVLLTLSTSCATLPTTQGESEEIFFLQDLEVESGGDLALLEGELSLTEGCLLVMDAFGSYSPVWPREYTYRAVADGVEIYNSVGKVVGRVGETVSLSGSEFSPLDYERLDEIVGHPRECPEPYWSVNGATPL